MNALSKWLRDYRRGWSDADLESVLAKIATRDMVYVSHREMRAHVWWERSHGRKSVFAV